MNTFTTSPNHGIVITVTEVNGIPVEFTEAMEEWRNGEIEDFDLIEEESDIKVIESRRGEKLHSLRSVLWGLRIKWAMDWVKNLFKIAPLLILASCTGGPSVTRTSGGGYHATTGFTLAAKRENVVAEVVTREGDTIRYSTTNEDSTEVPTTWIWWKGTTKLAEINQPSVLKGVDDPDVIPKDPNKIPKDPNIIPLDPNKLPQ